MTTRRIRALLATTAMSAVLVHGLTGHGLPQMSDEGMAGAAAGLCLLLASAFAYAPAPKPEAHRPAIVADVSQVYVAATPRPPLDRRNRASPSALQRFRN